MKRTVIVLSVFTLAGAAVSPGPTPSPSAKAVLASVRQATGGAAWDQFVQCDSTGTIAFQEIEGKSGSFHYVEDLKSGAHALRVEILERGVNQATGVNAEGAWKREDDGDIQLHPGSDPWDVDELYLASHSYWRPDFDGATVTTLQPRKEGGATYDRLEFRVQRGRGFILWVKRSTHLIDRIVYQEAGKDSPDSVTYWSDYRRVDGVLLPFLERSGKAGEEHTVTLTQRTLLKQADPTALAIPFRHDYSMPESGMVTVPTEDGIIVRGMVNGKGPYAILFDTGSINLLTSTFVQKMGLVVDGKAYKIAATGGVVDAQAVHIDSLQIGGLTLRDQTFYVIPGPWDEKNPPIGTIGYEALRRLAVKFDYEHGNLTLYDAPKFRYTGQGVKLPLVLDGKCLEVRGSIDGASGLFTLDTGNQVAFRLEPGFVKEHDLILRLAARYHGFSGRDIAGPLPETYYARVKTLRLGDTEVHNVIAHLATGDSLAVPYVGNIGHSILRQFHVTFDVMRGALYLEKNALWGQPGVFNRAGMVIDPADGGEQVMTIFPESPAAVAGLKVGDILTEIDGRAPSDDPNEPAFLQPVGTTVHLTVKRGDAALKIEVQLKEVL